MNKKMFHTKVVGKKPMTCSYLLLCFEKRLFDFISICPVIMSIVEFCNPLITGFLHVNNVRLITTSSV